MQQALHNPEGLGTLILDLLISKLDPVEQGQERKQWRQSLIGAILRSDFQSEDVANYGPEISSQRQRELTERFIARFHFPYMEHREEQVAQAHAATFRWIFDDDNQQPQKWSNFKQWLESDAQLYWITGKAGSGKSTLMKYICQPAKQSSNFSQSDSPQSRCIRHLEEWAAGSTLLIAKFFFWNSGTALQMTQAGLVRSLLHQILLQVPELVPHVSPKRWEALCLFNEDSPTGWNAHELEQMLRLAMVHLVDNTKLCLFIDGLDEFDGNHDSLIHLLKDILGMNSNVKLCVSSRPWDIFEDAFQHSASLRLQDLTYEDIKSYTSSEMHADPRFALLQEREPEYAQDLVRNVASKASGVFLWVHLVVSSLLAGMGHGDRIIELQKRLDSLPDELEELYDKMLDSVDTFYLERTAQILNFVEKSIEPPPVLLLSFADEERMESSWKRPIELMSQKDIASRLDTMRRRLNVCTKGLLEITGATVNLEHEYDLEEADNWIVHYLHRTVKDYLRSPQVHNRLVSLMKTPFDSHLKLCAGNLAYLKAIGTKLTTSTDQKFLWIRVEHSLYNAARISSRYDAKTINLMDELDKTLKTIFRSLSRATSESDLGVLSQKNRWFFETGQWVQLWPDAHEIPFGGHFLSLNVRYGVIPYVEARATRRCLIQKVYLSDDFDLRYGPEPQTFQSPKTWLYPLLLDAVSDSSTWASTHFDSVPNPDMVACLLRKGANFDWTYHSNRSGHHPWRHLLRGILTCWGDEENLMKWMKIAELALQDDSFVPSASSIAHWILEDVFNSPDKMRVLLAKLEAMRGKSSPLPGTYVKGSGRKSS